MADGVDRPPARTRCQRLFQGMQRVLLGEQRQIGHQHTGLARRRVESLCAHMQACQRGAGRERMRNVAEWGPRQGVAIRVLAAAHALHFVDPLRLGQRSAALCVVQDFDHRRASPAQMCHEGMLLPQRLHRAHPVVMPFDDHHASRRVHARRRRKRPRTMPAHGFIADAACEALQHMVDLVGAQHRPIRHGQFQAHAMDVMRPVHGCPPATARSLACGVGIDQEGGADRWGPACMPARSKTALPGRRCSAGAIRRPRRGE